MAGLPVPIASPEAANHILDIADLEQTAKQKIPRIVREFISAGSANQDTVRENTSAFAKYRLRTRVLVDVSDVDTSTTCMGRTVSFPLCVAPAGLQGIVHRDGELATSRACARKGINQAVSTFANFSPSAIREAGLAEGPIAHGMQIYPMKDHVLQRKILQAAQAAGYTAIYLTADSPVVGYRYNEIRNDFSPPPDLDLPNVTVFPGRHSVGGRSAVEAFIENAHDWEEQLSYLRSAAPNMEIWIKGILTGEDIELAIKHGCDGVLVSNHGGRQLDGVPATIDVLAECVDAAKGRIRIHIDGGIRSGSDIFKAIALGAECCYVGRPVFWGLAVSYKPFDNEAVDNLSQHDGRKGVELMIDLFHQEFKRCMQLTGCKTVKDITRARLGRVNADGLLCRL